MKTRYPILLVHGLGIKDMLFIKSFGQIDAHLCSQGYAVYTSKIDAFGTIEGNAAQLQAEILRILRQEQAEKVNLIAHSKGGLDARCMLANPGMAAQVASLTTLCTPHRGTPVAARLLRYPRCLVKYATFLIDAAFKLLGDNAPDSYVVCQQLASAEPLGNPGLCQPGILCQSFSSTKRKAADNATDGMVPRDSAMFGVYRGDCLDEPLSHAQIVDFRTPRQKKEKVYAFYSKLCAELAAMHL